MPDTAVVTVSYKADLHKPVEHIEAVKHWYNDGVLFVILPNGLTRRIPIALIGAVYKQGAHNHA